jgi:hypothetical protein
MQTKNYTLLLLLCFFGFGLQAQTKLSGEVVDKSNIPIPGVQVNLNNGLLQTLSDNAGKFTLTYPDTLKNGASGFNHSDTRPKRSY